MSQYGTKILLTAYNKGICTICPQVKGLLTLSSQDPFYITRGLLFTKVFSWEMASKSWELMLRWLVVVLFFRCLPLFTGRGRGGGEVCPKVDIGLYCQDCLCAMSRNSRTSEQDSTTLSLSFATNCCMQLNCYCCKSRITGLVVSETYGAIYVWKFISYLSLLMRGQLTFSSN